MLILISQIANLQVSEIPQNLLMCMQNNTALKNECKKQNLKKRKRHSNMQKQYILLLEVFIFFLLIC